VADKHQPVQKLYNAIVHAARKAAAVIITVDILIANLAVVNVVPALACNRRVTIGSRIV
jgi:hypothetical protein